MLQSLHFYFTLFLVLWRFTTNIIVIFFYNYSKESFIITVRWGTFERFQVSFLIATVWFALEAQFSQLINSQWYSINVSLRMLVKRCFKLPRAMGQLWTNPNLKNIGKWIFTSLFRLKNARVLRNPSFI